MISFLGELALVISLTATGLIFWVSDRFYGFSLLIFFEDTKIRGAGLTPTIPKGYKIIPFIAIVAGAIIVVSILTSDLSTLLNDLKGVQNVLTFTFLLVIGTFSALYILVVPIIIIKYVASDAKRVQLLKIFSFVLGVILAFIFYINFSNEFKSIGDYGFLLAIAGVPPGTYSFLIAKPPTIENDELPKAEKGEKPNSSGQNKNQTKTPKHQK